MTTGIPSKWPAYGDFKAVEGVTMTIPARAVTVLIGPSGCEKSTFLRSLNRMHEVVPGARVAGNRLNSRRMPKSEADAVVERSLRGANLWAEVKDRLGRPGSSFSGGSAAAAVHRPGDRGGAPGCC